MFIKQLFDGMSKTPITTVCVLGMHRSGTSCLAGSLQAAGLPGGKIMKYCIHNVKGSRENQSINDLNESIFTSNNGSWYEPPATIQYSAKHRQHRDRIIADLNSQFPVWMFKDPRTVLNLPFWQEKIPNLQLVASFRQPLKVAMSLYQRQSLQIPLREGIKLWIHYNSLILEAYNQKSFPLICFDSPQDEYSTRLSEIVDFLNTVIPQEIRLSTTKVKDFYESNLVHQEKTVIVSPTEEDRLLLQKADLIYQELRAKAGLSLDPETNKDNLIGVPLDRDSASYLKAIETQPNNAQLYFMLAKALEDEGDIAGAISYSRKALDLDCYSVDIVEQLSRLLSHTGHSAEAISAIESLIEHQPNNPRLYINLGNVHRSQRDFKSAVLTFEKILELIPDDALSRMWICDILIQDNRIEEAILACQKALKLHPQDPQIYFALGRAYDKQQDLGKAVLCYQKSIDFCTLSPGNVYFHLGNTLKKQNKIEASLEAYNNAIKFESDSYYGYFGLANYYRDRDNWERAISLYQKAVELECDNPQVYFCLGQSWYKQGQIEKAATAYEQTLKLHPQHFQANIELASCYSHLEQWDRAIQIYQKLLEINPENSKANFLLGEIFVRQENWQEAITAYEKTIELHPQHFQANIDLANCYRNLQQWDKAIQIYQKLLELNPNNAKVHLLLAEIFAEQENWQEAVTAYSKTIELNPKHFQANIELGKCYCNLQQWDKAIQIYQKLLELNSKNSKVHLLLGKVFAEQENWQNAIASCQVAIDLNHPNLHGVYKLMGDALTEINQIERAISTYEKAIAIHANPAIEKRLQKLKQ